ncbi:hypothetical protein GUJ93_ZPchr0006g43481 [Zizania palustris]|uniref:Cyclin N-terminal domain-containing protein n=1 Tax=Zizania palustris TaxID=103762 RepID=A0A8J5VJV0_ZIZPA|nr:hypothetical protein GUJ93_ZPchr0006g43481 [Zizania palustris]
MAKSCRQVPASRTSEPLPPTPETPSEKPSRNAARRGERAQQREAEPAPLGNREEAAHALRRGPARALPTDSKANNGSWTPPPRRMTRPRTRSVARAEAEDAGKRGEPDGADPQGSKEPDAGADQLGSKEPDAGADPQASKTPPAGADPRGSKELDAGAGRRGSKKPDAGAPESAVERDAEEIDRYLRSLEAQPSMRPETDYDYGIINFRMRGILVDWMANVAFLFHHQDETLHLAVSYVDRFLSRSVISQDKLQLLGTTALYVACKYEETMHHICMHRLYDARLFNYITDNTYTTQQVVKMEKYILKNLNFELGTPTAITFLRRFLTCCGGNLEQSRAKRLKLMCNYLADLSLLDHYCLMFLPSTVAAACLFVARFTISPRTRPWNLTLQRNTGYKISDVKDCISAIHDLQLSKKYQNLTAVRDKYKKTEFECVSTITSPSKIQASFLKNITR